MPKPISVLALCGEFCIDQESGDVLYMKLHEKLKNGRRVVVDFTWVKAVTAVFLSSALGRLYGSFPETVEDKLQVVHLPGEFAFTYGRVMEHSKRYFADRFYRTVIETMVERVEAGE